MEVVHRLDWNAFLKAYRRFVTCVVWKGSNFIAADKQLRAASEERNDSGIRHRSREKGTTRLFNPPYALHWDQIWERLVAMLNDAHGVWVDETFTTSVYETEAILNSRPFVEFNSDPSEHRPITIYDIFLLRPKCFLPGCVQ